MPKKISPLKNKKLLEKAIKRSKSKKEVLEELGLRSAGGNYKALKESAEKFNLILPDGSKITKEHRTIIPNEEVFVKNSKYANRNLIKKRLYKLGVLEICVECGVGPKWNGKKLTLQLEHINGIYNDNRLENLTILCPNCHSQTATYAGGSLKKKKIQKRACKCGNEIKTKNAKTCSNCASSQFSYPPVQVVRTMVNDNSYSYASKKLGVSNTAIKKFLERKKNVTEEFTKENWTDCINCDKFFEISQSSFDKFCSEECFDNYL